MIIRTAEYLQSAPTIKECPQDDKKEFAFIGRSNVGKSTLINMLTGKSKMALTSNKPGKTRAINHFIINDEWYLVDLPGFGYAKISQLQRGIWKRNLEWYLQKRENLMNVFLLVDCNIPPQKSDLEFANWLGERSIPFTILFTKADKPKMNEMNKNISDFKKEMLKNWETMPPSFITSANQKLGKEEVLNYIDKCLRVAKKG